LHYALALSLSPRRRALYGRLILPIYHAAPVNEDPPRGRPRLIGLIVLALCVGLLGFAIVSLSVGNDEGDNVKITGAGEVQSLLGGIPQSGPRLGSANAPVTVQVFNDPQCDPCSDWNREVIVPLIRGPVRAGDLQLVWHNFPMTQSGFFLGAYGAVAAAKQDYEWQFIELFFANQDEAERHGADQEFLDGIARGVGVVNFNVEQWQRDMDDSDIQETLDADEKLSAERRLPAQPAVVVGGPNGTQQLIESPSLAEVQAAIAEVS
jgi:protein-disulfide isomerase